MPSSAGAPRPQNFAPPPQNFAAPPPQMYPPPVAPPVRPVPQAPVQNYGFPPAYGQYGQIPAAQVFPPPPPVWGQQGLRGVGGWLMFLILVLTVFGPLGTLFNLVFAFTALSMRTTLSAPASNLQIVSALLSAPFAVWALTVGVKLWKLRPNAVQSAKQYLKMGTIPFVIVNSLLPSLMLPADQLSWPYTIGNIIGGVGAALVWIAYLDKSRRVANTYPQG
jgi:hypothetical protein